MKPYVIDTTVAPYGIRIELSPTMHGAILKVTFPSSQSTANQGRSVCFTSADFTSSGNNKLTGRASQVHHDRMPIVNFMMYIHIETSNAINIHRDHDMTCFQYSNNAEIVIVKMATSLISAQQAEHNFKTEVENKDYTNIYNDAKKTWHE